MQRGLLGAVLLRPPDQQQNRSSPSRCEGAEAPRVLGGTPPPRTESQRQRHRPAGAQGDHGRDDPGPGRPRGPARGAPPARGRRAGDHGAHDEQHRPPAGLEIKAAATMLAPRPGAPAPDTGSVAPEGIVELIAAVTGVQDDVADVIVPGAFRRTIAERRPKVCSNHRWDAPIGRVLDIKELLPGDPRLPRTTGDGQAWPRAAGALVATAQLNTSTKAGREAFEIIRSSGPPKVRSAWGIHADFYDHGFGGCRDSERCP
ncbi:MAG: hypothetical protein ABR608_06910 [Pseudonocardiaceae bacterium]